MLHTPAICSPESAPDAHSQIASASADSQKTHSSHIVTSVLKTIIKVDDTTIWNNLTDFDSYPLMFKRIQSVEITRRDGNFVYVESRLKPHLFIKHITQHMVNDLSAGPKILKWRMIDGNFSYVSGQWEIEPRANNTCLVKYTLSIEPGPVVPDFLVNLAVHYVQKEIVSQFKRYVEAKNGIKVGNAEPFNWPF